MADYQLVQPIKDNKAAFKQFFPGAYYAGDIGDASHQAGRSEHNPYSHEDNRNTPGWVYAQDLGQGGAFDLPLFARWLLDALKAGKYPEIKYIITRHPDNAGTGYFGLFDRRYGWRQQKSSGHSAHIHLSYQPDTLYTPSNIVTDFYKYLTNNNQEDDMPAVFNTHEIRRGVGAITTAGWPVVNSGALPWGAGYLSFVCDGGSAKLRVAIKRANNGGWDVHDEVLIEAGGVTPAIELPTTACGASIIRLPIDDSDTCETAASWIVELGFR